MKKFLPYILIFFILVQLFAPFSIGGNTKNNKAEAAEDCRFVDDSIIIPQIHAPTIRPDKLTVNIKTVGCKDKPGIKVSYQIQVIHTIVANNIVLSGTMIGPLLTDDLSFSFIPGEFDCKSGTCELKYVMRLIENGAEIDTYTNNDTGFACKTATCDQAVKFKWSTETVTPSTTFWFFEIKYADGSGFKFSPYSTLELCNAKRDIENVLEGDIKGECTEKTNEQIVSVSAYYFDKIKGGVIILESDNYTGETGQADCIAAKTAFDATTGTSGITTSECKVRTIDQTVGELEGSGEIPKPKDNGGLPACSIMPYGDGTFMGCVAQAIYYIFFVPTSFVFGLAGKALDFTMMYSIADSSYRSEFVVSGWKIVKDFCNMFFIFVLLYIAFGTILNLSGVKTKEMIINVVIIGLLINFSLFTTQVIIDASNILTRVFYNQKTIITGAIQKDPQGNILPTKSDLGSFGEIKLSEAIVSKVDPQQLIIQSQKVSEIKPKGLNTGDTDDLGGISLGSFIIVVFLSTAVNIVGTIVFLSSALIFIGRVVMLWMAMILSPLAFFSYIVPQMQGMKMIGWKNWWHETLSMAFVAPVFAFFMYIIVGFMDKGLSVVDSSLKNATDLSSGLNFVIAIIIPFAFIMVLLMKAKNMAVDMSGEMGAAMSKAGGVVGGLALGAATGGAALAMRGTIGSIGSKIASSGKLADLESKGGFKGFGAKMLLKGGEKASKGSFDVRNTKLGVATGSGLGVDLGKAKEGGYKKAEEDKIAKRTTRATELKAIANKGNEIEKRQAQVSKKMIEDKNSHDLHDIETQLTILRQKLQDTTNPAERDAISSDIRAQNDRKFTINAGGKTGKKNSDGTDIYNTDNGKMTAEEADKPVIEAKRASDLAEIEAKKKEEFAALVKADATYTEAEKEEAKKDADDARKFASDADDIVTQAKATRANTETGKSIKDINKDIKDIDHKIETGGNKIANQYATWIGSEKNKIANIFSTGSTARGTSEAVDNIRLGIKTQSSDSHGGGHSAPSHKAEHKPAAKHEEAKPASPGHAEHH